MKSDKYRDVIIGDINTFKKFYPKEYAKKLREDFLKNNFATEKKIQNKIK